MVNIVGHHCDIKLVISQRLEVDVFIDVDKGDSEEVGNSSAKLEDISICDCRSADC